MSSLHRAARAAGPLAFGVGSMVLLGWAFDLEGLKGAGGAITMKANAAVALAASGVSLLLNVRGSSRPGNMVADLLALLVLAIGALTLSQHVAGWHLGIDELLFVEAPGAAATASPGRMGPNASLSFTLAGVSLLVLRRRPAAAQVLAFGMFVLATIALVGYWYGAQELYSVARYTGIAWPTAVTLLILSIGLIGARDDAGVVAPLVSDGPGALLARRVLLPVGLVPLVLGYVVVVARDADLIDRGLATALFAVTLSILLSMLIWRTALILDAAARARASVERERDELLVREQRAREAAEHANRLKDEFLATLSHELRTPLNAILGWVELLRSDRVTAERRAHASGVVARNAKFLARLVEDLLDVSRIAAGQVQLQVDTVDVAKVAHRAVETTLETAKKKGVTVTAVLDGSPACTVKGDPERLQQIINNLMANAVKFTPSGGLVHVSVTPIDGQVELVVRDTGRGIGPDFLPHVFDRFRQEDATSTREHGGLGLGLSIARELAQLHGGSITAESAGVGQGAVFTLTLPRS